jgi:hypothetical protein
LRGGNIEKYPDNRISGILGPESCSKAFYVG